MSAKPAKKSKLRPRPRLPRQRAARAQTKVEEGPAKSKAAERRPVHGPRSVDYPAEYLADILKSVKTIAMVGASSDPTKFSYGVLRVLHETGYDMIPVNPKEAGGEIRGLPVFESLQAIDRPIDMVQVFRTSDALLGVAKDAIDVGAKVLVGTDRRAQR